MFAGMVFAPTSEELAAVRNVLAGWPRAFAVLDNPYLFDTGDFVFLANEIDVVKLGGVYYIVFYVDKQELLLDMEAVSETEQPVRPTRVITFSIPLLYDLPEEYVITHDIVKQAISLLTGRSSRSNTVVSGYVDSTLYTYMLLAALKMYAGNKDSVVPLFTRDRRKYTFDTYFTKFRHVIIPRNLVMGSFYGRPSAGAVLANVLVRWATTRREAFMAVLGAMSVCGYIDTSVLMGDLSTLDYDCTSRIVQYLKGVLRKMGELRYKQYLLLTTSMQPPKQFTDAEPDEGDNY